MPKNVLILGGYNWVGYNIIKVLLEENSFTNFIIVDSFQNQLWKDSIKQSIDTYRYLYDENIFLFSIDIKDKYKLEQIYAAHHITHVISNIKYNTNDIHMMEKIDGYHHIQKLNIKYNIQTFICIYRSITHKSFGLNNDTSDHVTICDTFNNCVKTMVEPLKTKLKVHEIILYDYVFGNKKDKYNEIISMYQNIIKCHSPCYVEKCNLFLQYDQDFLNTIEDKLLNKPSRSIRKWCYPYLNLYETIYYEHIKECKHKDKLITDNTVLLDYIKYKI